MVSIACIFTVLLYYLCISSHLTCGNTEHWVHTNVQVGVASEGPRVCQLSNSTWVLRTEQQRGKRTQWWLGKGEEVLDEKGKPHYDCVKSYMWMERSLLAGHDHKNDRKVVWFCFVFSFVNVLWRQIWAPQDSRNLASPEPRLLRWGWGWGWGEEFRHEVLASLCLWHSFISTEKVGQLGLTSLSHNLLQRFQCSFESRWHDKYEERGSGKEVFIETT